MHIQNLQGPQAPQKCCSEVQFQLCRRSAGRAFHKTQRVRANMHETETHTQTHIIELSCLDFQIVQSAYICVCDIYIYIYIYIYTCVVGERERES
jgi:hypothetical protein